MVLAFFTLPKPYAVKFTLLASPNKRGCMLVAGWFPHIADTKRAFAFRALWFQRGFDSPLASYDQDIAAAGASGHPVNGRINFWSILRCADSLASSGSAWPEFRRTSQSWL
jgi:hypothetical protein